jgi:hypothetical protein
MYYINSTFRIVNFSQYFLWPSLYFYTGKACIILNPDSSDYGPLPLNHKYLKDNFYHFVGIFQERYRDAIIKNLDAQNNLLALTPKDIKYLL